MAEDGLRLGGLSSGLALILNGESSKENSSKTHLVSSCDEIGYQSVERTLDYVFGLPNRSIGPLSGPVDGNLVRGILKNELLKLHANSSVLDGDGYRDGICIYGSGCRPDTVGLDEISIRGDIRIIKPPLLVESLAMFSSARANASVWKGKWMYEVILETAGIQQIGWATVSCPFTDHKGVGEAEDSYAFDGRRVRKWNRDAESYGQTWVVGDVIGCCIDLDCNEISFYRNGVSLGLAFNGIRKMGVGCGYYPAVSLSQGERCELNFGGRPFKFPIEGYHPLQAPPSLNSFATQLLRCLSRLLGLHSVEQAKHSSVEKLRLKRFVSPDEIFYPVSHGICEELFSVLGADVWSIEYVAWCPFLSFMVEVFGLQAPHDYSGLDRVLDVFLEFNRSHLLFEHIINALACCCKTAPLVLKECPCSGSYPYLALACHILRRQELMVLWWKSPDFEYHFEGFLSRKDPNKNDLECMMPSVWWPGSCEDVSYESSMLLMTTALSEAVNKIEEKHRDLCRLVIQFIPPVTPPQLPGSVFRKFLQNLLLKNRGADRNLPPPGVSSNSVLVSLYTVILHFLSEGFGMGEICGWLKGSENGRDVGFLHRGGHRSFPMIRKQKISVGRKVVWMMKKPDSMPERSSHVTTECSAGSLSDDIADKPSSSYQSESDFSYCPVQHTSFIPREGVMSSATLREEELLDVLLLLYHIGLAPNFKQASYYMNHQLQSIANLEETDKKIREGPCFEQLKHLKEARNAHREEVIDSVRQCAWFRISLSSRWKQRGMYATCMWTVQLLLVLSKVDLLFTYVPEYYLEALVDCFHVLRKSDPPFVPSSIFIKQGLASFITFVVTHFNDPRICSADLRDLLLQSISVLVQSKEYLAAFEGNEAVKQRMPKALLSAFDNRSWIPVTNILLRLCKGSGFGSSKHGESSSSSSIIFQRLLGQTCISDEALFSAFLNRLFNTLSWTMTEFSVSVREMQEKYQVLEFQQKKCSVIYDLSCNLARVLEFCTHEIPQAFLSGADTNLRRLTELIVFILNHITSAEDTEFFDLSLRRHGQSLEKVNRGMVLAPLVGIILNLINASEQMECREHNDVVSIFASMGCLDSFNCRFQYLLDYNWAGSFRGDDYLGKLVQLENFLNLILLWSQSQENKILGGETDVNDDICCICYSSEADARFAPCSHRSCYGCITRHLLNCHRCFFCNATVLDVVRISDKAD
ncbi:hypothetical protein ACLB2K_006409 [Fragaria x ananassa]